jgi:hypothetical protein
MSFKSLLVCAGALLVLLPVSAFAQETGGGVAAPAPESVPAQAAQEEETPTTPGGEEQPSGQEDGDTPTTDDEGPAVDLPLDGAAPGAESVAGEALPRSGFEAYALGAIGLGLLLAGAALRPTSSWPPPRDRLSRSTTPR